MANKKTAFVVALLALLLTFPPMRAEHFTTPKNISNTAGFADNPRLTVDPFGTIFCVWENNTSGNWAIFFSYSEDGGETFSPATPISGSEMGARNPTLATDNAGGLFVAWQYENASLTNVIGFGFSVDYGQTFTTRAIYHIFPVDFAATDPAIAVDGDSNVNIAYKGQTNYQPNVLFTRSTNSDRTFAPPRFVSLEPQQQSPHALITDSLGSIFIAWYDGRYNNVQFTRSRDGGSTFSIPREIGIRFARRLTVAIDSEDVLYLAADLGNTDINFLRSLDGGDTFTHSIRFNNPADSSDPALATGMPGLVYLAWQQSRPRPNSDIFFRLSEDWGESFSDPINVSNSKGGAEHPHIAVDGTGQIFIVWRERGQIFFTRSIPK